MGNLCPSSPITTQHVERKLSPIFRAAVNHVCGYRPDQEDAHVLEYNVNGQNLAIFGVFDGHGGARCSQWLSKNITSYFKDLNNIPDENSIPTYFLDAGSELYEETLTALMLKMDADFIKSGLEDGSTACIVLAQPWDLIQDKAITTPITSETGFNLQNKDKVAIRVVSINIGDSRAIIVRRDADPDKIKAGFEKITEDHKPTDPEERKRVLEAGGFVQAGRVDGSLALSRAFGDVNYKLETSLPAHKQRVIAVPDFEEHLCEYGDILLVACDGIFESPALSSHDAVASIIMNYIKTNVIDTHHISKKTPFLAQHVPLLYDPALLCRTLIQESIVLGSKDNHTAMIVSFAPLTTHMVNELKAETDKITSDDTVTRDIKESFLKTLSFLVTTIPSLPSVETIPGYFRSSAAGAEQFQTKYIADLTPQAFQQHKDLINATTKAVSASIGQNGFKLPLPWLYPSTPRRFTPDDILVDYINNITLLDHFNLPTTPPDVFPLKDEFVLILLDKIVPQIDEKEVTDENILSRTQFLEPYKFVPPIVLLPCDETKQQQNQMNQLQMIQHYYQQQQQQSMYQGGGYQ